MDDNSIMPFGKKKGLRLGEVSDGYLLRLYDAGKLTGKLKEYVENRIPYLRFGQKSGKPDPGTQAKGAG